MTSSNMAKPMGSNMKLKPFPLDEHKKVNKFWAKESKNFKASNLNEHMHPRSQ